MNWHHNVANGPTNTFTYTDRNGIARTVRLMDAELNFKEADSGGMIGSLKLRIEY
jgi:hypothetical protein